MRGPLLSKPADCSDSAAGGHAADNDDDSAGDLWRRDLAVYCAATTIDRRCNQHAYADSTHDDRPAIQSERFFTTAGLDVAGTDFIEYESLQAGDNRFLARLFRRDLRAKRIAQRSHPPAGKLWRRRWESAPCRSDHSHVDAADDRPGR